MELQDTTPKKLMKLFFRGPLARDGLRLTFIPRLRVGLVDSFVCFVIPRLRVGLVLVAIAVLTFPNIDDC